jgi:hypothetical protein
VPVAAAVINFKTLRIWNQISTVTVRLSFALRG